jgi:hypothetical protein
MVKTIYLNLEDDITKITARIAKEAAPEVVLVFPKGSFLFSDSINLRLLKKQVDLLGKEAAILTMDEVGQIYAKEAGFPLKFLSKKSGGGRFSDITPRRTNPEKPRTRAARKAVPVVIAEPVAPKVSYSETQAEEPVVPEATPTTDEEELFQPIAVTDSIFSHPTETAPVAAPQVKNKSRRMHRVAMMSFVAASLVIVLLLVLVVLPSATITVHAKTQAVSRDVELSAATAITEPDSSKLALPATAVRKTLDVQSKMTTSGKREVGSKAQGTVLIYNLSKNPLNLKSSTTTLSVGSKTYVFTEDQASVKTVPNANVPESDLRSATIIAVNGGEDSNLPAGTRVEITNQVFGAQPQFLYAKTKTAITGGTSRFISVISEDDYKKAQDDLRAKAASQIREELKAQNLTFLENAYALTDVAEFKADKPVGTESPQFDASGKVTINGLAFNTDQLSEMIRNRISATFPAGKKLQDKSQDSMTMKVRGTPDINNGILGLTVHSESSASYDLDIGDIRPKVAGKSKEEVSELMLSRPEVDRVDITLSPSWQNTIPRFQAKIKVDIKK